MSKKYKIFSTLTLATFLFTSVPFYYCSKSYAESMESASEESMEVSDIEKIN